jgi:DNA mismatch repair ATPase MutS
MNQQTSKNLGILTRGEGRASIFDLLNLTYTKGGSEALRIRCNELEASRAKTEELRKAIQYFMRHSMVWEEAMGRVNIRVVEEYVRGNVYPLAGSTGWLLRWKAFWCRHWDYYQFFTLMDGFRKLFRLLVEYRLAYEMAEVTDAEMTAVEETPLEARILYKYVILLADKGGINVLQEKGRVYKLGFVAFLKVDAAIREKHKKELEGLLEGLYEVDALLSMARATKKYNLVFPYSNHCYPYN